MKFKFLIVVVLCSFSMYAQQEPHYTQYMYNMSTVNPGYMINEPGLIKVGSLYRTQWVGIEGAPKTANIFAHIPLSERIELSVNYLKETDIAFSEIDIHHMLDAIQDTENNV